MPTRAQLPQNQAFPPITPELKKTYPDLMFWMSKLLVSLRLLHQGIGTTTSTSTQAGTFANLPPAGTPGRLYYATDTHVLYGDDGTVWTAV